jgi:hypothetical protein
MSDVSALAEGVAERLWQRIQAQDRLDALDEHADGPTYRERLAGDGAALAAAVDEALSAVLAAVAHPERRAALRTLCRNGKGEASPPVEELLRAGLAVATWTGDGVTVSDAGRALSDLCDAVTAHITDLVESRLRPRDAG